MKRVSEREQARAKRTKKLERQQTNNCEIVFVFFAVDNLSAFPDFSLRFSVCVCFFVLGSMFYSIHFAAAHFLSCAPALGFNPIKVEFSNLSS